MLPLYALSITSTFIGSEQMKREIDNSNKSKLLFHYHHLEFELNRMSKLINEYANDYGMLSFPTLYPVLSDYEVSEQLNDFYRKLRQIQESSPYIEDVLYYVPAAGRKVSSLHYISRYENVELYRLLASRGNLQSSISVEGNSLYYVSSVPFNLSSEAEPSFVLAFKLNRAELQSTLNELADGGGGGAALLFGDGRVTLTSAGLNDFDPKLLHAYGISTSSQSESVDSQDLKDRRVYSIGNVNFGFQLVQFVPKRILQQPIEIYTRWLWILTVFSGLIIVVFSYWILRLIYRPLTKLTRAFKLMELGMTKVEIPHQRKDEFGFIYTRFNGMIQNLSTLIDDNYIQRIRSQDAELKQLQSQITPHFLYNSLFTIKQMAEMEDVDAIKQFSDYLAVISNTSPATRSRPFLCLRNGHMPLRT